MKPPSTLALPLVAYSISPMLTLAPFAPSAWTTVLMALASDWPCEIPPGHPWLCRDQLEVLSITIRMLGLALAPAEVPVKMSMSSAVGNMGARAVQMQR